MEADSLRRFGVSLDELVVGDGPNALDTAAGAREKPGTGERNERHKEGVLDQVLPLLIIQEAQNVFHFFSPSSPTLKDRTNRLETQDNQNAIGNDI
jgi:hypothetical protein